MRGLAVLFFFVCLANISFDLGSATKCYICSAVKGKERDCEVNVKNAATGECANPIGYCMTAIVQDVIARSCSTEDACDAVEKTSTYCKVCNSDLCNAESGAFIPAYSTSLMASLSLFALIKLFT